MNWLKQLFKPTPKQAVEQRIQQTTLDMVGEPVISFVNCLKANPKRFKLQFHSYFQADKSGLWGDLYNWVDKTGCSTGFASLTDKKDGSVYYATVHGGQLYRVAGLSFSLNAWEYKYIYEAFVHLREKAQRRKDRINQGYWERQRKAEYARENEARLEMMEKFK